MNNTANRLSADLNTFQHYLTPTFQLCRYCCIILQMMKQGLWEMKEVTQNHTASEWQDQISNLGLLTTKATGQYDISVKRKMQSKF